MSATIKNPRIARKGEEIGGGYFVFRRGDDTGRIRPSPWPFEHPTLCAAKREADRLAQAYPGYRFDVVQVCYSVREEAKQEAAE
jgi:hypothetical protein